MDWRNRNYYLLRMDTDKYHIRMRLLKSIKSVKIHSPYGHFKYMHSISGYDGGVGTIYDIGYVQHMISCKKEDEQYLEQLLNEMKEVDFSLSYYNTNYMKLNREICGQ